MSENMTIESFFLADYQRLKMENDELEAIIREYELERIASTTDCGFIDLGKKTEAFRCEVASSYSIFDKEAQWGKLGIEELNALAEMETEALLEEAKNTRQRWSGVVYEEREKTFPFTVEFVSYKGRNRYAYDPDRGRTELVEVEESADTSSWVSSRLRAECRALAAEELREIIQNRITKLRKKEESCTEE